LHLTVENVNSIYLLKKGMNRNRSYFNWDHLKNSI
jgi:hypothetical protein